MTKEDVIEEIKLTLTGGVLELEIEDKTLDLIVQRTLRELQRYWDESTIINIPFASCIDYSNTPLENCKEIVKVYRTVGIGNSEDAGNSVTMDPLFTQQWMVFSNAGTMYNLTDYVMNYAAWTTLTQIRNTMSTDMAFRVDKQAHRLYINNNISNPSMVAVEYIPNLTDVEQIKSEYWQDILIRLATAYTKQILGRIRSRFVQSGALWTQDGDKMLQEGTDEINTIRETLRVNSNLNCIID